MAFGDVDLLRRSDHDWRLYGYASMDGAAA
jgi:hypothetical protein